MSATKHARVTRLSDALLDTEWRLVGAHRGVQWVTDRYVIVRVDMLPRAVTSKGVPSAWPGLSESRYRSLLGGIPRDDSGLASVLDSKIQHDSDGRTFAVVTERAGGPGAAWLIDAQILPLLSACDRIAIHKGRVVGFQKRPGQGKPVLVCVVMTVAWRQLDGLDLAGVTRP